MSLDLLWLKEEANRLSEDNQTDMDYLSKYVKFPEGAGSVTVRLLGPAEAGMFDREKSPFFMQTRLHRVNNKSKHCLKEFDKKAKKYVGTCPICEYYNWLWNTSEQQNSKEERDKLQKQARDIKPVERYYFNCIVRQEKQEDGSVLENVGPKILSVGKTLYKMIITGIVGDETIQEKGYGDVTHPTTGRDFKIIKTIKKSGDNEYPNYDSSKFLDQTPLGTPEQIKTWMSSLHDLVAERKSHTVDELKTELKKHLGVIPNDNVGNSFDPSEYQSKQSSVSKTNVSSTPVSTESIVNSVSSAVSDSAVESSDSDEFFEQLKNLT